MSLKNSEWNVVNTLALLDYPEESLGFKLGSYLLRNNLDLEKDDIFRILVCNSEGFTCETCLQYYLFGNGRRNLPSIAYVLAGTLLEPYKGVAFFNAFKKGKNAHRFYDLDFSRLLHIPLGHIQTSFNIS